jgi:hypothetical protein
MEMAGGGKPGLLKIKGKTVKQQNKYQQVNEYDRVHFPPGIQKGRQFIDILFVAGKHSSRYIFSSRYG